VANTLKGTGEIMKRKDGTYAGRYQAQLGKVLRAVRAEATELAVKFGSERGPKLRQAVLDERNWWESGERIARDEHEDYQGDGDPLNLDLDCDPPELIRSTCLTALDLGLAPEEGESVGPPPSGCRCYTIT
jgi:hypothetical protein